VVKGNEKLLGEYWFCIALERRNRIISGLEQLIKKLVEGLLV